MSVFPVDTRCGYIANFILLMFQVVKCLQDLYEFFCNDFLKGDWKQTFKGTIDEVRINKFRLIFSDAVELPVSEDKVFYRQLKRLQTTLETKESMLLVPKGLEARRRISFFSNSLFMTMPRAPQVMVLFGYFQWICDAN